ncbi:MAG: hypothetical protein JWN95_3241 [Frankiales bacterium]|nr:hypothetical protein [Frankiales bacterium]
MTTAEARPGEWAGATARGGLGAWQRETAARLLTGAASTPDSTPDSTLDSTPDLMSMTGHVPTPAEQVGWSTTVALYRQWRLFRIRTLAPVTVAVLGDSADLVLDSYLSATVGSTTFRADEARAFLAFVARSVPWEPHLTTALGLETALLAARRPEPGERLPRPGWIGRSNRASLIELPMNPAELLLWGAGRAPRPVTNSTLVLVAPKLPGWFRVAAHREASLWHQHAVDRPLDDVLAGPAADRRAASVLCDAGALVIG